MMMMMTRKNKMAKIGPIVEIVIRGDVGCGKSTICQLIQKALKAENITNVTLNLDEKGGNEPSMTYYQCRTKSLRHKNTEIRIRTEQLPREEVKKLHNE